MKNDIKLNTVYDLNNEQFSKMNSLMNVLDNKFGIVTFLGPRFSGKTSQLLYNASLVKYGKKLLLKKKHTVKKHEKFNTFDYIYMKDCEYTLLKHLNCLKTDPIITVLIIDDVHLFNENIINELIIYCIKYSIFVIMSSLNVDSFDRCYSNVILHSTSIHVLHSTCYFCKKEATRSICYNDDKYLTSSKDGYITICFKCKYPCRQRISKVDLHDKIINNYRRQATEIEKFESDEIEDDSNTYKLSELMGTHDIDVDGLIECTSSYIANSMKKIRRSNST